MKNKRSRVLYWSFISKIAKEHNLDTRIIEAICLSPFKYAKDIIEGDDLKPVMFAYLGKLKLKKQFEEDKNKSWK